MNSMIFHTALVLEALANRLIRLGFRRILAATAIASPLALLAWTALRFDDPAVRAHAVVLGCERIVVALVAALLLRAVFSLFFDLVAARLYQPQASGLGTAG